MCLMVGVVGMGTEPRQLLAEEGQAQSPEAVAPRLSRLSRYAPAGAGEAGKGAA